MEPGGTLSASVLAEWLRPALIISAVLLSALVLAHTLRRGAAVYVAGGWALATLLLPHVAVPLYLAALLYRRPVPRIPRRLARWALPPFVYFVLLLAAVSVFYWRDYHTFDACLERAAAARLRGHHTDAVEEYEQALELQPDAHTRKLLALELMSARRYAEAIEQWRLLEGTEADDGLINFYAARALDELKQAPEAQSRYETFLRSEVCTQALPDARCQLAVERMKKK